MIKKTDLDCENCSKRCIEGFNYPKALMSFNIDFPDCLDRDIVMKVAKYCKKNCRIYRNNLDDILKLDCKCPALVNEDNNRYCRYLTLAPNEWNEVSREYEQ